jgi:hypothetical protein
VFIDGYYAGTVDDFDGFFQRLNIGPGEHDLELYLAGHRSAQQKVYLQPGRTFRVRHTMEALRQGDPEPVRPAAAAPTPAPPQPATAPQGRPSPPARPEPPRSGAPITDYGTLSLRVNENKDINVQVAAGWSTVEIPVPEGQLKEGENALQFFFKSSGNAVAWIQIGGKAPLGDDGSTAFYDAAQKSVVIPKEGQMSWFVMTPDKAKLTGDLSDGSCTVAVLATADDGATIEGKLVGTGSAVDLAPLSGKAIRLDLEAQGCETAALANASLVVPGEAPQVKRGEPPKYVLFIIMDSLRADRVRAFNPKARAETPNFEKLAESATLFMQHFSPGNESQVSHASMWTSMYLAKHKASQMKDKLPESYVTIDDVAKKAGKYVAGVSANGYIRPERGFGTSWDKFTNHIMAKLGLKGVDVMEKGLSFITPKKDQPWFLYLGMIDTHVTWRAKEPWIDEWINSVNDSLIPQGVREQRI